MDWRKNMGVKSEKEHFDSYLQYPHNPQKGGLRGDITDITDITDKDRKVKNMNEEVRYWFGERAAIMEYDGGFAREEAETLARERLRAEAAAC